MAEYKVGITAEWIQQQKLLNLESNHNMKKILFSILLALLSLGFGVKKANAFCAPDYCRDCEKTGYDESSHTDTCGCLSFNRDMYCIVTPSSFTSWAAEGNCDMLDVNWGIGGMGSSCDGSYWGSGGGGAGTGCMK